MSTQFTLIDIESLELLIDESSSRYNLELWHDVTDDGGTLITLEKNLNLEKLLFLYQFFNGDQFGIQFREANTKTNLSLNGDMLSILIKNEYGKSFVGRKFTTPINIEKINKQLKHLIQDHFNYDL